MRGHALSLSLLLSPLSILRNDILSSFYFFRLFLLFLFFSYHYRYCYLISFTHPRFPLIYPGNVPLRQPLCSFNIFGLFVDIFVFNLSPLIIRARAPLKLSDSQHGGT